MTVYKWSEVAATNASSDSTINWAEGQAPSSVNDSARAMMAAITKWRFDSCGFLPTTGTSTAYTFTSFQVYTTLALMNGAVIGFMPHTTSGAAPTLNVDGLGPKVIRSTTGVALAAGALVSGNSYLATFNVGTSEFLLHNQPSVLPSGIVLTASITDANVTYAKIQNVTAARLLGNPTGGSAALSEISLGTTLAFSGSVLGVPTAGIITANIADANVSFAKIQNLNTARLLGNPTGGNAAPSEITLDTTLAFSGAALKVSPSTGLTAALAVDYASKSDQQTGSSTSKTVNPAHQQDHKSAIKAHGQFEGRPTASLLGGYGFNSIARTSAGLYVLTFTTAFANTTYTVHVNGAGGDACSCYVGTKTTTTVQINTVNLGSSPVGSDNKFDVMCAGDQ